jgi:hypothetical protein
MSNFESGQFMTMNLVIYQMFCVSVPHMTPLVRLSQHIYKDVLYNLTQREVPVTIEYSDKDN